MAYTTSPRAMSAASADSISSALEILIHPLVVMSIADHHTRTQQEHSASSPSSARVFGLLFGQQDGRSVNVLETVEMAYKRDARGKIALQLAALEVDMKLFSASYSSYECLGWYSTGSKVEAEDFDTHRLLQKYNERPLYLMLDPSLSQSSRDLPLSLYEESIHVLQNATTTDFSRIPFTVHADEAERITSLHCAKLTQLPPNTSHVIPHYSTLHNAVASLHQRLLLIRRFLDDTAQGAIPMDHAVLREVAALVRRLPVGEGEERERCMMGEYNDSLLLIELGVMTRLLEDVQELNDRFAVQRSGAVEGQRGGVSGQRGKRSAGGFVNDLLGLTD